MPARTPDMGDSARPIRIRSRSAKSHRTRRRLTAFGHGSVGRHTPADRTARPRGHTVCLLSAIFALLQCNRASEIDRIDDCGWC